MMEERSGRRSGIRQDAPPREEPPAPEGKRYGREIECDAPPRERREPYRSRAARGWGRPPA